MGKWLRGLLIVGLCTVRLYDPPEKQVVGSLVDLRQGELMLCVNSSLHGYHGSGVEVHCQRNGRVFLGLSPRTSLSLQTLSAA